MKPPEPRRGCVFTISWPVIIMFAAIIFLVCRCPDDSSGATRPSQRSLASAYGPGLYGNHVACGGRLYAGTVGVASRSLRCGTRLQFRSRSGRWVSARVIDRGPFVGGRSFDLTNGLVRKLGYRDCYAFGVRTVTWRLA